MDFDKIVDSSCLIMTYSYHHNLQISLWSNFDSNIGNPFLHQRIDFLSHSQDPCLKNLHSHQNRLNLHRPRLPPHQSHLRIDSIVDYHLILIRPRFVAFSYCGAYMLDALSHHS